ncbi:LamG domain-containing protein [Saccharicrinis sp. FJH54]|uniref:LamG domain-containing protein n=1 Tax=Saccharicrinis sp. FJH54 TaxID=3344665 RepID=UPI0035D52484
MKTYYRLIILVLTVIAVSACNQDYIDPISSVSPGSDTEAPVITIKKPVEGGQIKLPEDTSSVTIDVEVTDDIELASVTIKYDGTQIAAFSDFKDYRRALETVTYNKVLFGDHSVTVEAKDKAGKTSTSTANFQKSPPYSARYDGEIFYLPFNGDYMNMIRFDTAIVTGTPGFADEGIASSKSYEGAADSYIQYPLADIQSSELSMVFWIKINPDPNRAGIMTVGSTNDDAGRKNGFRLFREGDANSMRIKLNVGTGAGESWNDGDVVNPSLGEWVCVAVTISDTENTIYFDGLPVRTSAMSAPIDWTGCDFLTIGSGAPTFTYWDHLSDLSEIDEVRFFDKALTQDEIKAIISQETGKEFTNTLYMPFDDNYTDQISLTAATAVGTPGFADDGKSGKAYLGATDSYLTFPADGLMSSQFSATFWMKVNAVPDRAGIITIGSTNDDAGRKNGLRFFREGSAASMRFKLNVGTGDGESWNDGDVIDATTGDWVHVAFTISDAKTVIYLNGVAVNTADMANEIDWTGCSQFTIGSGEPTFTYWGHLSDNSEIDELRFYNIALTATEVQAIMNNDN